MVEPLRVARHSTRLKVGVTGLPSPGVLGPAPMSELVTVFESTV